ncbi:hypothetical protein BDZ45DRAFT_728384 [Acephala macrosclerotiorum]|nr:hypothetical protein BDZ45DRAFT_728384 [Acephala macrosclerotiorum]
MSSPIQHSQHNSNEPLPPRWEQQEDAQGRTYYINHATRTTTWIRPNTEGASEHSDQSVNTSPSTTLPRGWERRETPAGIPYFIDHSTRTTTWIDPRTWQRDGQEEHEEKYVGLSQVVSGALLAGPLPRGWEMKPIRDEDRIYFIDHNTRRTSWKDPRLS